MSQAGGNIVGLKSDGVCRGGAGLAQSPGMEQGGGRGVELVPERGKREQIKDVATPTLTIKRTA